jgi:hypothetical protein
MLLQLQSYTQQRRSSQNLGPQQQQQQQLSVSADGVNGNVVSMSELSHSGSPTPAFSLAAPASAGGRQQPGSAVGYGGLGTGESLSFL